MIDYRIDVGQPHTHRFPVSLTVRPAGDALEVSLPVWIPGSYLIREFQRHLLGLQAEQGGEPCIIEQLDKARWRIACRPGKALTVRYEVYAHDTSVRAAFLDTRRGFFNGTSVFLRVEGHTESPHRAQIVGLPKGWSVGTALPSVKVDSRGQGWYQAQDYDALVDHPVELGPFWRGTFTARGVAHELIVSGAAEWADLDRLMADTRRICEAQITFWHGRRKPPFQRYVFLLNVVEDGYGGLEHRDSTALICARKDLPRRGVAAASDAYQTLLGLVSHEYFHTWNVKRLKPTAFAPYDYTRENHTDMLWFFEGFTSYYDDLLLLRCGLLDLPAYLKLLAKPVNQVLATPGRQVQSVAQASFDAWTRYYRPDENTANATVSYYTKGSLVALALDLSLRLCPALDDGRAPSLDGVMKRLWALGRPINESDVATALQAEAGCGPRHAADWGTLLADWVHGTQDLPLKELLDLHGVHWTDKAGSLTQQLGVRLQEAPGGLKVQAVMHGSPAEQAGLSAGDELLAIGDWRLRKPDDLVQFFDRKAPQPLLLCRDQQLMRVSLPPPPEGPTPWCHTVTLGQPPADSTGAGDAHLRRRQAWLGH